MTTDDRRQTPIEDPSMTPDVLDRVRAADISPINDRPAFDDVVSRLRAAGAGALPRGRARRPWRLVAVGGVVTGALAASLVVVTRSPDDGGLPHLGVLQAAAATARADPAFARFSGYTRDERVTVTVPGRATTTLRNREIVRRVSSTEFEGTLESTSEAPGQGIRPAPQPQGVGPLDTGGARVTERRVGDVSIRRFSWTRPYGTIFSGAVGRGERPVRVPTDPREVRAAIASWANGRAPADGDPSHAASLRDAYGADDGTQLALGYATDVLTAPQVAPAVRAAAFSALADVAGVQLDPDAVDPAGRPAAVLTSTAHHHGGSTTFELFIEPDTARVLGTRVRSSPPSSPREATAESDTGESRSEATYRYVG